MSVIRCGEREWPNLESLICDASRVLTMADELRLMRRIVMAAASRHGGLRIPHLALHSVSPGDGFEMRMYDDPATKEVVITAERS